MVYWWKPTQQVLNKQWPLVLLVLFIVISNEDSFLYDKEYSLENHFREPLREGEDHCWLLWAQNKDDKPSDRKANA